MLTSWLTKGGSNIKKQSEEPGEPSSMDQSSLEQQQSYISESSQSDESTSSSSRVSVEEGKEEVEVLGEKVEACQISEIRISPPGPKDISKLPTDGPVQPRLKKYPGHIIGRKEPRLNPDWHKNKWLEYFASTDSAYCFDCRHFGTEQLNDSFITSGFRAWNRASGKNPKTNALLLHKNSDCHLNSVAKREAFTSMSKAGQTVTDLLDKAHQDRVLENRHYIKTVAEVVS